MMKDYLRMKEVLKQVLAATDKLDPKDAYYICDKIVDQQFGKLDEYSAANNLTKEQKLEMSDRMIIALQALTHAITSAQRMK